RARRPVASSTPPAYAPVSVARAVRVASIDDGSGVYHQSRSLVPLYALAPFVGAPERLPTVTAPLAPVMSPANVKSAETEPSRMLGSRLSWTVPRASAPTAPPIALMVQ